MMKRLISLVICAAMVLVSLPTLAGCTEQTKTLNIFNWGQYIANGDDDTVDIIAKFEKETGIKVNYLTYESNEAMYAKLKSGGASYDIVIPSDYMIARLIEDDMLASIDFSKLTNYSNIDDSFKNPSYDPENKYSVPYTWGTVGIIYNTKYVTKTVDSWEILWDSDYKDKILMFSNSRDAMAIGQLLAKVDPNTHDYDQLKKASEKLAKQRPYVQDYVMDQIFDKMVNEVAWIAPYYAGDYLVMAEENEDLEFCLPKEGFNRFVDSMCILKDSPNYDAAHRFIDFILREDVQFENVDYIGYSSPFKAELIPEDYIDEISYPDAQTLERSFTFDHLPTEVLSAIDKLWIEVRIS